MPRSRRLPPFAPAPVLAASILAASILAASILAASILAAAAGGTRAAADLSSTDRDYLGKDAAGAAYELALARLGAERASRIEVKRFAAAMAADHETYNAALLALGKSKGLDLSKQMGTVDEVKLTAVKALSGSLFDKAFLEQAQSINADDVKEASKEMGATEDADVKAFVAKFSSMDKRHEAEAQALRK